MSSSPHRQADLESVRERRLALVAVDLQNDFCEPGGVFARAGLRLDDLDALVREVNELAAAARDGGHPVVWTRMVWDRDEGPGLLAERSPFLAEEGLRRGSWGAELVAGLDVAEDDLVLDKTRFSSFFRTDLERTLAGHELRDLVVAGVRTDFCVESTVRDAFFRDLNVFVAEEAVAGYVRQLHEHSLRLMGTVFARVIPAHEALALLRVPATTRQEV